MVIVKDNGYDVIRVYGLTQYDYGQEMVLDGMDIADGTEIHLCQRNRAITKQIRAQHISIPDYMLQYADDITAYLYLVTPESGETVKKIVLQISSRDCPEGYVTPDEPSYSRLIPFGGSEGQFLLKASSDDFDSQWGDAATDLSLEEDVLQLMCGTKKIGERIRLSTLLGREVELRSSGTAIQWRYTDSNEWTDLVTLVDLTGPPGQQGPPGPPGETPELEIRDGNLYAIYGKEI